MAAAANKPGAVHYSLIIFVMLSVVLGITTYMFQRESEDKKAEIAKVNDENKKANQLYQVLNDQVQQLKAKIGGANKEAPLIDQGNPQAGVLGAFTTEIRNNGKDVEGLTATETLRKFRETLDVTAADRDAKAQKILALEKEVLALKNQYQSQVDNYSKQTKDAERAKTDTIKGFEEKLSSKTQEISSLKGQLNVKSDELQQEKESREKESKKQESTITKLLQRIEFQKAKIDNLEKLSFEEADGKIVRIDHAGQAVWINLGEADFLKTRMTFSVYAKENPGVGRGQEDIKGKIEVTSIKGPHLAEAKIIEEDLYRPIVSEDLIYTPIWSPGLIEKISIIGKIDMDNDGRDDREQLYRMMANAGAIIDNEVNEEGVRIPENGQITVGTRFLVLGDIPDPTQITGAEEKKRVEKIRGELDILQKEARENGVRILKLNDFLAYIGFHNKRRTFLAGQERPFALKAGAASETTRAAANDRKQNEDLEGPYSMKSRSKKKQSVSDGANSKLFGGGGN